MVCPNASVPFTRSSSTSANRNVSASFGASRNGAGSFAALRDVVTRQSRQAASTSVSAAASASAAASSRVASGVRQQQQQASRVSGLSRSQTVGQITSQVEQAVINARAPLQVDATERVTVGPYSGIQLNKHEEQQFRGPVPLTQYRVNEDSNPEVIRKRLERLRYQQEVAVRHLRPPTPPRHGDLIIRERQNQVPAAPPVVLREESCRTKTPAPAVFREQPPRTPTRIPEQVVEVEGQPIPPPARRVVVERLANIPAKPQNILIERWLPYGSQKRRVVFQRACAAAPPNPRNLIIEWEAPEVEVEQVCKDLGVERADPEEYRRKYNDLRNASDIPNLCQDGTCQQAQQQQNGGLELEGDVEALRLVDLDRHGLGEYRRFLGQN